MNTDVSIVINNNNNENSSSSNSSKFPFNTIKLTVKITFSISSPSLENRP